MYGSSDTNSVASIILWQFHGCRASHNDIRWVNLRLDRWGGMSSWHKDNGSSTGTAGWKENWFKGHFFPTFFKRREDHAYVIPPRGYFRNDRFLWSELSEIRLCVFLLENCDCLVDVIWMWCCRFNVKASVPLKTHIPSMPQLPWLMFIFPTAALKNCRTGDTNRTQVLLFPWRTFAAAAALFLSVS